jgi:uncharacterized protein (TIGR01777 family)
MRILVSGASGFVGGSLVSFFQKKKAEVVPLLHEMGSLGETTWRAGSGSLEDFDAVIHLAGEPLSLERWTAEKRRRILDSRKEGTAALSLALARLRRPPAVFISASAIGYYGDRGEELLDEGSAPGKGFLARVCEEWEQGSRSIDSRGARIVHARFGMVLGLHSKALEKLVRVYRLGLGGRLSTGEQWISWVALTDLIHALDYILRTESLHGPVNIVSPHAVRQKEFSRIRAGILRRPAFLPLPAWVLRLCFGAAADEILLASARVFPSKLSRSGFHFRYPELQDALRGCLQSEVQSILRFF